MRLSAGIPSAPDPYRFDRYDIVAAVQPLESRTRTNPRLVGGQTTAVFIVAGQSLAANTVQGLSTVTNTTKVDNLSINDGGTYRAEDPLLGCANAPISSNWGNTFTRVADKLVTAATYQRVILIPVAIGGTTVATWDATMHERIVVGYRRAAAVGLPVTAIIWQQGETDKALGTSKDAYKASFLSMLAKVQAAGCTAPWIIGKSTWESGASGTEVRSAITELVNGTTIFLGADTDSLDNTNRYDTTHLNATGANAAAELWKAAIQAADL